MRKIYSIMMMLAMMVAAVSFTACSGDDDNGSGGGKKTLVVDGERYYDVNSTAEQTKNYGMYFTINAAEDPIYPISGHELTVKISPSKVSQLREGDVFDVGELSVREFRHFTEISVNTYDWDELDGNIMIKKITSMEMTIEINDLLIEHEITGVQHTISGTAVLTSGTYDSDGNLLSFKEAID